MSISSDSEQQMRPHHPFPLREKLPLLPEPVVQNELATDERDTFLASFDDAPGFRSHFTTTTLAKRTDRKHQPPRAQSDFVTYAFERYQWSKPLFVLALYTGLRRSDLRLLRWESIDLSAGVIRLIMRKTKRPVLLPDRPEGSRSARPLPQATGHERVRPTHA